MFHRHAWELVGIQQGKHVVRGPVTFITKFCTKCGKMKCVETNGHWDFDEVQRAMAAVRRVR